MNKAISTSFFIASLFLFYFKGYAQITLPKVFGDNMVLQRGITIPVWGQAGAGSLITAEMGTVRQLQKPGKMENG